MRALRNRARGEGYVSGPNRAVFDAAIEAWNAGDLDRYLEMYDEAILLHGYGDEPMTKPEVSGMYRGMFDAIGDIHLDIHDVVESGEKLVARATLNGTHTGEMFGVPGTGTPISQGVITILRFADGRCVERWSVADTLAVLLQIGAVQLPS